MEVLSCWGFPILTAKGKCLLGFTLRKKNERFLDGGVGALPKFFEAYMCEVVCLAEPTQGRTARPSRALAQREGIVA